MAIACALVACSEADEGGVGADIDGLGGPGADGAPGADGDDAGALGWDGAGLDGDDAGPRPAALIAVTVNR